MVSLNRFPNGVGSNSSTSLLLSSDSISLHHPSAKDSNHTSGSDSSDLSAIYKFQHLSISPENVSHLNKTPILIPALPTKSQERRGSQDPNWTSGSPTSQPSPSFFPKEMKTDSIKDEIIGGISLSSSELLDGRRHSQPSSIRFHSAEKSVENPKVDSIWQSLIIADDYEPPNKEHSSGLMSDSTNGNQFKDIPKYSILQSANYSISHPTNSGSMPSGQHDDTEDLSMSESDYGDENEGQNNNNSSKSPIYYDSQDSNGSQSGGAMNSLGNMDESDSTIVDSFDTDQSASIESSTVGSVKSKDSISFLPSSFSVNNPHHTDSIAVSPSSASPGLYTSIDQSPLFSSLTLSLEDAGASYTSNDPSSSSYLTTIKESTNSSSPFPSTPNNRQSWTPTSTPSPSPSPKIQSFPSTSDKPMPPISYRTNLLKDRFVYYGPKSEKHRVSAHLRRQEQIREYYSTFFSGGPHTTMANFGPYSALSSVSGVSSPNSSKISKKTNGTSTRLRSSSASNTGGIINGSIPTRNRNPSITTTVLNGLSNRGSGSNSVTPTSNASAIHIMTSPPPGSPANSGSLQKKKPKRTVRFNV